MSVQLAKLRSLLQQQSDYKFHKATEYLNAYIKKTANFCFWLLAFKEKAKSIYETLQDYSILNEENVSVLSAYSMLS